MPDHDAFLRAVIDHADDVGPRLVYADWLDERGDPRGEFIRLQCAREHVLDPEEGSRLYERMLTLLAAHRTRWEVPRFTEQVFRRGFVEELMVPCGFPLDEVLAVFTRTPVRAFGIRGHDLGFPLLNLLGRAAMRFVQRLDLRDVVSHVGDEGLAVIARSPYLAPLTHLYLGTPGIDSFARELQRLPFRQRIHAFGMGQLAQSRYTTNLVELELACSAVSDAGLVSLANSPNFARLEHLGLGGNEIGVTGDDSLEILCESRSLAGLKSLDLRNNSIGRAGRRLLRERFGDAVLIEGEFTA